jgi:hemerythrin-like metal-binding protein
MALLRWSKKYSVGVVAVDREHAAFLKSLNQLHAAMIQGKGKPVTISLLRKLPDLARDHFASEESLMKAAHYPQLAEHHAKHEEFAERLNELVLCLKQGDNNPSILLLKFMREWITNHIQTEDQAFGPWLNDHGIH